MRKLLLSGMLVAISISLFAQKLDEVQERISKGKYDEAKDKIDKFMADPKNQGNANAYYYQGVVYAALAKDSTRPATATEEFRQQAFNSFQKYQQLDPKNIMMTLNQNANLFQIYADYFNAAIASYNAQQFDKSFYNFKNALNVEQYIVKKGYTYTGFNMYALDTNMILNTANMAVRAKQEDSAMKYYQMLADAKIKGPNYEQIYQMIVDYYGRKNDAGNRAKYLAIGKELYPDNEYWMEADLTPLRDNKPQLMSKYEELLQANPNKYFLAYNYAVELYNYTHASDKRPADAATWEPKLEPAIQKAIAINNAPEANFLMVKYYLDNIYNLQEQYRTYKGNTPAEISKRKAITAQINSSYDKLAPFAEAANTAYSQKTNLTPVDKATYRNTINVLVDYYTNKKQMDKAKTYQDKLKTL